MSYTDMQEMFLVALSSHAGADCTGPNMSKDVSEAIREALYTKWKLTNWEIVWGPGVTVAPHRDESSPDVYPANVMFAAYDSERSLLFISVSATNVKAKYDAEEDFRVHNLVLWPYGHGDAKRLPKISKGAQLGLNMLQEMKAGAGLGGDGESLRDWLSGFVAANRISKLITGGHSLGGALSPLVACWLRDTQRDWDPELTLGPENFACRRFAGPTPGNRSFAIHYESTIGDTISVVNPLDVVPRLWDEASMQTLTDIYCPSIKAGLRMTSIIDGFKVAVAGKGYTQMGEIIKIENITVNESIILGQSDCEDFTNQMGYQHLFGYFDGLEISERPPSDWFGQFSGLCTRPITAATSS